MAVTFNIRLSPSTVAGDVPSLLAVIENLQNQCRCEPYVREFTVATDAYRNLSQYNGEQLDDPYFGGYFHCPYDVKISCEPKVIPKIRTMLRQYEQYLAPRGVFMQISWYQDGEGLDSVPIDLESFNAFEQIPHPKQKPKPPWEKEIRGIDMDFEDF
jgi:hypothetical protein